MFYLFDVAYWADDWSMEENVIVEAESLEAAFSWIEARVLTCEPTADIDGDDHRLHMAVPNGFQEVFTYLSSAADLGPLYAKSRFRADLIGVEHADVAA